MENWIRDIVIILIITPALIKWWLTTTDGTCKKFIFLTGISFFISVIANVVGNVLNITFLIGFAGLTFIITIYFLIRAIILERKLKHK